MTDASERYFHLLGSEDTRFAAIGDPALDGVLQRGKASLVQILRGVMDEISKLPDAGPGCDARRRAKVTWLAAVLSDLDPPQ
jgi:hypothetical protein